MKKKTVGIACVLCALMMIMSSTVVLNMPATKALPSPGDVDRSSEIVFWDDFENGLSKWDPAEIIEENGGVFTTSNAQSKTGYWSEESTNSLYVNAGTTSMAAFGRMWYPAQIQEDYTVVFDFRLGTADNHWFKVFADTNVFMVIKYGTELIQYLGENVQAGSGYQTPGDTTYQHIKYLQADTWFRIELRVYLSRLQYDVYIDGDFVRMSDFTGNSVHYPEYFVVGDQYTKYNRGIGYWDNIHVGPTHTIPFEEDFEGAFNLGQWTTVVTSGETLEVVNGDIHVDSEASGTSYVHTPFLDFGKHRHYIVRFEFRYVGAHHFFKVYIDPNIIVILDSYSLYSFRGGSTLEYIGDLSEGNEHSIEFRVSAQPPNSPIFSTILDGEYLGEKNGRFDPYLFGYVSFGDTKDTSIRGEGYWKSMSVQPDKRDSTWAMSLHRRWNRDSIEDGYAALEYVRTLDVSYARLNFVWKEIEPSDNDWDLDRIKWYHNLLDMLEGTGLDVILIADQWDDAPDWAKSFWDPLDFRPTEFYYAYWDFVEKLANEYGAKVHYYQILNECNHHKPWSPVMGYTHCANLFHYGYQGLMTGENAVEPHDDKFETIVNVFANTLGWTSWITNFMSDISSMNPSAVDIIAVDHYGGLWPHWPFRDPEDIDWSPLDTIESLMTTYTKKGAIMETGYDTTDSGGDEDQKDWIYYNLPVIQDRMMEWNRNHNEKYVLQAYYELRDEETDGGCPLIFECKEFGLMRDDWTEKVGYHEFGGRALDFHRWSSVIKADRDAPGHQAEGGGTAFADIGHGPETDALFMIVDTGGSPGAENNYKYVVFWDIQPDGGFLDWDAGFPDKQVYGTQSEGGGVAIAQIDNDPAGRPDVVFMNVDIGSSENQISYRIGWNINTDGSISLWSPKIDLGGAGGQDTDGGGIALGDLDNNGNLDALVMVADAAGDYRYKIAWDIQPTGTPQDIDGPFVGGWSIGCDKCSWGLFRRYSEGAGVELLDIDGNGVLDAVFTALVNPEGSSCMANRFMYRIAWNAKSDGTFDRWSATFGLGASAGGHITAGGGLGLADVNIDGKPDLIFMSIPDTGGGSDNEFKYRVKWDVDIWTIPYD